MKKMIRFELIVEFHVEFYKIFSLISWGAVFSCFLPYFLHLSTSKISTCPMPNFFVVVCSLFEFFDGCPYPVIKPVERFGKDPSPRQIGSTQLKWWKFDLKMNLSGQMSLIQAGFVPSSKFWHCLSDDFGKRLIILRKRNEFRAVPELSN